MVLKPLGEKIVNILVNGTQEASYTQDETENSYDISASTSLNQNVEGNPFSPNGESTVWVVIIWGQTDPRETSELNYTIEDGNGNELDSGEKNFSGAEVLKFVYTDLQVQGTPLTVSTSVFPSDADYASGKNITTISAEDSISIDDVTQS